MAWSGPGGQRTLSILEFRLMVRCTEMVPVQMQERVEAIRWLKQQSEGVPRSGMRDRCAYKIKGISKTTAAVLHINNSEKGREFEAFKPN
jgi:hypothetical protein